MTLSTAQINEFKNAGYSIVRRMVPPATCDSMLAVTADQLQAAVAPLEYEAEVGYPGAPDSLDAAGGRTVRRLRGAYQRHPCDNGATKAATAARCAPAASSWRRPSPAAASARARSRGTC